MLKVDRLSLLQKWELVANKSTHLPVVPLSLHFCFVSLSLSLSLFFSFFFFSFFFGAGDLKVKRVPAYDLFIVNRSNQ